MGKKYRNSDFKNDTFYKHGDFYERLKIARAAGKDVYFNEVRKINNSKEGRKYIGDISIQDIFMDNWKSFLEKYDTSDNPIRPSIKKSVTDMMDCQNPRMVFLFLSVLSVTKLKLLLKHVNQGFAQNVERSIVIRLLLMFLRR